MNEIFFRVFVYINARFWEILHESPDFFLNIVISVPLKWDELNN